MSASISRIAVARLVLPLLLLVTSAAWAQPTGYTPARPATRLPCTDACVTLKCDGATDDSAPLQALMDSLTTLGGTICVPNGKTIALAATVVPKSNVSLQCMGGSGFKATGAIATAMFKSTPAVNNWTVDSCEFDLNSKVGINAYYIEDGANYHFWRNTVTGVGTGSNAAWDLAHFDCTAADCDVVENSFTGSNTAATTDTCLAITGATSRGNNCINPGSHGIVMSGVRTRAYYNAITGLVGTSGAARGIDIEGGNQEARGNYIESAATTGSGIYINGAQAVVTGNQIVSNAVDTLSEGITVDTCGGADANIAIASNQIWRVHDYSFRLKGVATSGIDLSGNKSRLSSSATPTLHPEHILADGVFIQNNIATGNYFTGGWRGFDPGTNTLVNFLVIGNRFLSLSGAAFIAGPGAGFNFQSNYVNPNGQRSTSCDATCSGSSSRGKVCTLDTDCTTCNGSVQKCIPEPVGGYLNTPIVAGSGSTHPNISNNLFTSGASLPLKQCTVAGNIGQLCDVASCASAATCSGTPSTCQTGGDAGKLCCQTAGGATCAVRTASPYIRVPDGGSASSNQDVVISGNQFISGTANSTMIDFVSSASLGNISVSKFAITGNMFSLANSSTSVAIALPTVNPANIVDLSIAGNSFLNLNSQTASTTQIVNYQGSFGNLSLIDGGLKRSDFPVLTTAAQTIYSGINGSGNAATTDETVNDSVMVGSGTIWKMTCSISIVPGGTSTRKFTLRKNAGATTMLCTVTAAIKTCTPAAGSASAPIAFADGDTFDMEQVSVVGTSLAAATGSCILYGSYDTAM